MSMESKYFSALKHVHHLAETAFNDELADPKELLRIIRQIHDTVELATGRQSIVDMADPHHPHFTSPDWHIKEIPAAPQQQKTTT